MNEDMALGQVIVIDDAVRTDCIAEGQSLRQASPRGGGADVHRIDCLAAVHRRRASARSCRPAKTAAA